MLILFYMTMLLGDFKDEKTYEGRSALIFNVVTWKAVESPPRGVDLPTTVKQSSLPLGKEAVRLRLLWDAATKTMWLDTNADGNFDATEKQTLTSKPVEIKVNIDGKPRLLLVRVRDEVPLFALQGYATGTTEVDGKSVKYALFDGDSDGCFDRGIYDRLLLDVDGNGTLDPLTETFTVGTVLTLGGHAYVASPSADGLTLTMRKRPTELGTMRFLLIRKEPGAVKNFDLHLMSEFGELIKLNELDKDHRLPVGKYRVSSLDFNIELNKSDVWSYHFWGSRNKYDIISVENEKDTYELLPELRISGVITKNPNAKPGDLTWVTPEIGAKNGLKLSDVTTTVREGYHRTTDIVAKLMAPGSQEQDRNIGCLH